ncbi:MAG TPA: hypothetical protein VGM87_20135 [Roseomonas sp.]
MTLDSLWPWRAALIALAVALLWVLGLRRAGQPALAPAGLGLGVAIGWILAIGLVTATPRQWMERLPLLAAGLALFALVLAGLVRGRAGRLGLPAALLAVLAGAWWMAGGPTTATGFRHAAPMLGAVAAGGLALLLRLDGPEDGVKAGLALAAGLIAAKAAGPQPLLALVIAAAALGALLARAEAGAAAGAVLAPALAALAVLPVMARGTPAGWAAAVAPLLALWLGPRLGALLPGRIGAWLGWALAAAPAVALAWWFARHGH